MAIDGASFQENRVAFPLEELAKYAGLWIAWAPDGASVVASSLEMDEELDARIQAAGYNPSECCLSYVPHPDDVIDGAFILKRALVPEKPDAQPVPPARSGSGPEFPGGEQA
jgi:hypothetical protein